MLADGYVLCNDHWSTRIDALVEHLSTYLWASMNLAGGANLGMQLRCKNYSYVHMPHL